MDQNFTPAISAPSGVYLTQSGSLSIQIPKQRNTPLAQDRQLAYNAPGQTYIDCRTVVGWMKLVKTLIREAWDTGNSATQVLFTHDYGLLPEDPKNLVGVIIVWEVISKVPALTSEKNNIRQIKPVVRDIQTGDDSTTWIWAQSFDCVVMFTIYGDSWDRMYEYVDKFEELMTTYAGIFIGTGLQQFTFREQTRDALYDLPRTQSLANKSLFYNARIEKQTPVVLENIESILIKVGAIGPFATGAQDQIEVEIVDGIPGSPELPGAKFYPRAIRNGRYLMFVGWTTYKRRYLF